MESGHRISLIGLSLTVILLLASCHSVGVHRVHGSAIGPPVHAPAHGYRRRHLYGYDLVYDSSCGLYVATGLSHHYYHDGHFYRLHGDIWEVSVRGVAWRPVGYAALPSPLRVKFKPPVVSGKLKAAVKAPGPVGPVIKAPRPVAPVLKAPSAVTAVPKVAAVEAKGKAKAKARGKGWR